MLNRTVPYQTLLRPYQRIIMRKFTYTLDLSSKKFICPDCNKKTFVRYKDHEGNYHEDESFGRCDRENNCGCLNIPKDDTEEKTIADYAPKKKFIEKPTSFIPVDKMASTWSNYKHNPFTVFLVGLFGDPKTVELIKKYRWGVDSTSIYTMDYTLFWQIDNNEKIRSAKMIKYKPDGHRDKDSFTTWYHKKTDGGNLVFPDFNLKQCLYGEHLLKIEPTKPVAIVESEKTAIIASVFIPKYLWLACGGKGELSVSKMSVLQNRNVTLFPDLGAYNDWKIKAREFGFNISNHIEKIATDEQKKQGLDLADFLL